MSNKFLIKDAFKYGWEEMKKHWKVVLGALLLTWLISFAFESVNAMLGGGKYSETGMFAGALIFIISIISFLVSILMSYNFTDMMIKISKGDHGVQIKDVVKYQKEKVGKITFWILGCLLFGVVVTVGIILFIIPGIYLAARLCFAPYLMIDKDMGIEESFRKSWSMTKNEVWHLIGLWLASFIVMAAGVILFVVGVIPAYVITLFAFLYVYKKLLDHNHGHNHTTHIQNS